MCCVVLVTLMFAFPAYVCCGCLTAWRGCWKNFMLDFFLFLITWVLSLCVFPVCAGVCACFIFVLFFSSFVNGRSWCTLVVSQISMVTGLWCVALCNVGRSKVVVIFPLQLWKSSGCDHNICLFWFPFVYYSIFSLSINATYCSLVCFTNTTVSFPSSSHLPLSASLPPSSCPFLILLSSPIHILFSCTFSRICSYWSPCPLPLLLSASLSSGGLHG